LSTLPTATFDDGDAVYLSEVTAGEYRVGIPTAPNHGVFLGFVIKNSNGSAGELDVRVQNYQELDELSDVYISSVAADNFLIRNATNTRWENKTTSDVKTVLAIDTLELKTKVTNAGLLNGFIRVTVVSNDLIVAISTSPTSQVDPTSANPVYVWIGNTLRSITGALSVTSTAGANRLNMGSSELATKEVDLFVYIGWRADNSTVCIAASRIPYARVIGDFVWNSNVEKGLITGGFANVATDDVANIGRFAATLSASASYNWSVPSFTNANLIQEPVYETRSLTWQPVYAGTASLTYTSVTTTKATYQVINNRIFVILNATGTTGGTASHSLTATIPFTIVDEGPQGVTIRDATSGQSVSGVGSGFGNQLFFRKFDAANWGLGTGRIVRSTGMLEI